MNVNIVYILYLYEYTSVNTEKKSKTKLENLDPPPQTTHPTYDGGQPSNIKLHVPNHVIKNHSHLIIHTK